MHQLKAVVPGKSNANVGSESDDDSDKNVYSKSDAYSDRNVDSKSDAGSDQNVDSESEFSDVYAGVEPDEVDDFSRLDIWHEINEICGKRTGKEKSKFVLKTILNLTLLTRALS